MKRRVAYIIFADVIFILLLSVSGLFDGVISDVIYYLAFAVPFCLLILLVRREGKKSSFLPIRLSGRSIGLLLPTVAPTLALVFVISFVTSFLISLVREPEATPITGNMLFDLFGFALLPALLEEALFRYAALAMLAPADKKAAIIISAVMFAFAHSSLYQIPYALVAGVVFATLDIMLESIWPSVILHFINNAASVVWIYYSGNAMLVKIYITVLAILAALSIFVLLVRRKAYKQIFTETVTEGEKYAVSYEPILFIAVTLIIAITAL